MEPYNSLPSIEMPELASADTVEELLIEIDQRAFAEPLPECPGMRVAHATVPSAENAGHYIRMEQIPIEQSWYGETAFIYVAPLDNPLSATGWVFYPDEHGGRFLRALPHLVMVENMKDDLEENPLWQQLVNEFGDQMNIDKQRPGQAGVYECEAQELLKLIRASIPSENL